MPLTATETWARLLDRARQDLPEQVFRTWLEPTEALSLDQGTLTVGTPDRFAAEWNDSKHGELLASYAPVALGHPLKVLFRVDEERTTRPQMDFFIAPLPEPTVHTADKVGAVTGQLNPRYTFDNFVIGKSNELAAAAAQAVAAAPGSVYNPLFIYGATGLGKTHLMQAVAHEILQRIPATRLAFVGTEQFTNEMVASIQSRKNQEFRRRYREIDLLLVDDVHFLKGKEATQQEFFHTFNALYEAGRQIILTSDRPPAEIAGLEARLVSRFQWGMVADIELPDLEHRIAILQNKATLDHLELTIPNDVLRFVAQYVRSSVRELEGSLIRLLAFASLKHQDITIQLAREALRDKVKDSGLESPDEDRLLTPDLVQETVAQEWGVSIDALRSKSRTKQIATARQVAMYLIRELLLTQLVEIGILFGGRDHSTVIHSLDKVANLRQHDPAFDKRISNLQAKLGILHKT
ncbi:MAG TPA: chromosomal replication initiator protein DnaA [Gemmatimonadaceae bacterium]|nr:chromosomal replication initiator protein DnaA [Gemmatimonadaceae bacterium]